MPTPSRTHQVHVMRDVNTCDWSYTWSLEPRPPLDWYLNDVSGPSWSAIFTRVLECITLGALSVSFYNALTSDSNISVQHCLVSCDMTDAKCKVVHKRNSGEFLEEGTYMRRLNLEDPRFESPPSIRQIPTDHSHRLLQPLTTTSLRT
jgi:hypothetical protein